VDELRRTVSAETKEELPKSAVVRDVPPMRETLTAPEATPDVVAEQNVSGAAETLREGVAGTLHVDTAPRTAPGSTTSSTS
jgi:hypothetical protein